MNAPTHDARGAAPAPENHDGHHDDHDVDAIPTDLPKVGAGRIILITLLFVGVLVGLFFVGYLPRHRREAQLRRDSERARDNRPVVMATAPRRAPQATELSLPGDARAMQTTAIHPRANGYLKNLKVDI